MGRFTDKKIYVGTPVTKDVILVLLQRVLDELDSSLILHCSFPDPHRVKESSPVGNARFRLTWVFEGTLCTTASFERKWERRYIQEHELFLSGTGSQDETDIKAADCKAIAILFYASYTRLVYSEFKSGQVVDNPYYHTMHPAEGIEDQLLDVLNQLMNEPLQDRQPQTMAICRALLEQLKLDIKREYLFGVNTADRVVTHISAFCQQYFYLPINVSYICDQLNLNPTYASNLFHLTTGQMIKDYLLALRLEKAEWLLKFYDTPIEDIAQKCGFSGANYFIRVFRSKHGVTPGIYRKRHRDNDEDAKL